MSKIIGVTVGTPLSADKLKEKIKPVMSVNGVEADETGNVQVEIPEGAGGITETARNLLFTILRAAYYSSDQTSNIDALMAALMSGGDSSGGESGGDSGDDGSGDSTDAVIEQIGSVLKIVSGVTVTQQGATLTIR